MGKSKNILSCILFSFVCLFACILLGCANSPAITASGNGKIIESVYNNGNKTYTAVADEWNEFLGWYDGDYLYSNEATIKFNDDTPKNLKAKFSTNGLLAMDRFLSSAFEEISSQEKKEYFNFQQVFDIDISQENQSEKYVLEVKGAVAQGGDKNILDFNLKTNDNITKISAKIENNGENSEVLLKIEQNEYYYQLPFEFLHIAFFENKPTIQSLSGENYNLIQDVFGNKNSLGLIENVVNSKNKTEFTFRVDKLLEYAKNIILPNVAESDVFIKELLETFTKKYQGLSRQLPVMKLIAVIEYDDHGYINDIYGDYVLEEDYKLELEETVIIKKFNANFNLKSSKFEYNNNLSLEEIDTNLEDIQVANFSLEGKIDFAYENSVTYEKDLIDSYSLIIHSDINPLAFADAIEEGEIIWEKVDWKNIGFLNLAITLDEIDDNGEQIARHNGVVDYINVLIDSNTYGENMLVYAGLYNPKMNLVAENYLLNNAFYLPAVMNEYENGLTENFPKGEFASLQVVVDALKSTFGFIINNDGETLNEIVYNFISNLIQSENDSDLADAVFIENGKVFFKTANARDNITQSMSEFSSLLGYTGFTNNLFGSASHIVFDFTNLKYGSVDDKTKQNDIRLYNQKHTTLIGLCGDIKGIDDVDFSVVADYETSLKQLIGKEQAFVGVFSDLSESEVFTDYKTANVNILLTIYNIEVLEENENEATIRVFFTYNQGLLASTLYNKSIPYGLIAIEKTIEI